jgi:glucose-6-phosphate isomerase
MSSKPLLTADPIYQKIQEYYNANGSKLNIKQLLESDPKRFEKFSITLKTPADGEILLVSRSKLKKKTFDL